MISRARNTMTKIIIKTFGLACALALLAGCVTPPTQGEYEATVAKIGYGATLPDDWQDRVKAFMETRLKDPISAQWKFETESFTSWAGASDRGGVLVSAGHVVTALLNAKNSYGAFIGFTRYRFMVRDGKVIAYQIGAGAWEHVHPHYVRAAS